MAGGPTLGVDPPARSLAPLRAIDWRFLLPTLPDARFHRLAVLGGPEGSIERAEAAGLADETWRGLPPDGSADAVIARADAPHSLAELSRAVAPDGILYVEISRGTKGVRSSTPAQVIRALRAAGLSACALYSMEPNVMEARAFVSLDAPAAASWHRATALGNRAAVRIANAVRQSVVRVGGRTIAALNRPYAVIASRGDCPSSVPGVLREPAVISALGARPVTAVMLTYGSDRALYFPFGERGSEPLGVVKVPKIPALIGRTENEQSRMRALRSTLDASLAAAIPEPLGIVTLGRTIAACERFAPGMTVAARAADPTVSLGDKAGDLRLAVDWIARFHRATETRRAVVRDSIGPLASEMCSAYERRHRASDAATLCARLRDLAASLGSEAVAFAMHHRDFAVWNLVRSDAGLTVIDWEGAGEGIAAFDVVHLAMTWLLAVRRGTGVHDECAVVCDLLAPERDAAAAVARDAVETYLRAMTLDRRLVPLLVGLHRVELAVRRTAQLELHDEAMPNDALDADLAVVRALATRADVLLPLIER